MEKSTVPGSVRDEGWVMNKKTSITERGMVDYDRIVVFKCQQSEKDLQSVCEWLETHGSPGTEHVYVNKNMRIRTPNAYVFRVTRDSSD